MQTDLVKKTAPVFAALLSALMFSFGGLIVKLSPWQSLSINGARNMVAAVITFIWLKSTGHKIVLNKSVFISAFAMCFTTTAYCTANKLTTAANTILLQFTSPVFVIILSWLIWKQMPKKRDVLMCVTVFAGICLCFCESLQGGSIAGDLIALASGVSYAVVFMCNKMKGGDAKSTFLVGEIMSSIICLPFLVQETDFSVSAVSWGLILGLFLGCGYALLSVALKSISPVQANLISAIEPVLNPIWVAVFYNETVSGLALAGFVIVVASIVFFNIPPRKAADT